MRSAGNLMRKSPACEIEKGGFGARYAPLFAAETKPDEVDTGASPQDQAG